MELESDNSFWPRRRTNTLTGIIHGIFEQNIRYKKFKNRRFIDESIRLLLIKNILLKRNLMPDGLSYFSRIPDMNDRKNEMKGICKAISGFFSQLVDNNLQDRFVQDLAGKIISLEERSLGTGEERYALESDLIWLFGDYEELKREIQGFDREDISLNVKLFLDQGGKPSIIPESTVIIFDGFDYLTRIEEDILFNLFQTVHEVWLLLDSIDVPEDAIDKAAKSIEVMRNKNMALCYPELGSILNDTHSSFSYIKPLISRLEGEGVDFETVYEEKSDTIINPGEAICFYNGKGDIPLNSLKIRSFPNRVSEVKSIAGEIKRIIKEDDLDPSRDLGRIRVLFPYLNTYSSLIFEIFQEYGIPFSLTQGLPLYSHPLASLFRSIFKVPLNGFQMEDIFTLFSSDMVHVDLQKFSESKPFSALSRDLLLPGDDAARIERITEDYLKHERSGIPDIFLIDEAAKKCGLTDFNYSSSADPKTRTSKIKNYYIEMIKIHNGKQEELYQEYYNLIINIEMLEQKLDLFREIKDQEECQGIEIIFNKIITSLGFPEKLVDISKRYGSIDFTAIRKITKRDTKAFSLLMEIIKASTSELSLECSLSKVERGYSLLTRFYSIFESRLKNSFLLDERNPDVVRVSQWLEVRGRSFEYIFAGGLTSEEFPLRERINFIIPESSNNVFRMLDPVEQSRKMFFHILRNYKKKLYLSYPLCPEEREARPSPMLSQLEDTVRLYGLSEKGFDSLEDLFKWDDSPYMASLDEMLNATYKKEPDDQKSDNLFPLGNVIIRPGFPVENLLRSFSTILSRNSVDGLYENDGIVISSSCFKDFLLEQKKEISPSHLDSLANCPMRFLFKDIYKLKTREELGVELSPKEMGVHIHAILKIFFNRLLEKGKNVSDFGLENAFLLAGEIIEAYLMKYPFLDNIKYFRYQIRELIDGLERHSSYETSAGKQDEGILARLLRYEAREFGGKSPGGIEIFFGNLDKPSVLLGDHRISGYIDRYDIDRDKSDTVYIYDYKTGRIPSSSMVKKGLSFQLPVYMKAMRDGFGFKKIYASYYSLKKERFIIDSPLMETLSENTGDEKSLDLSGIRLIDDYANELLSLIAEGLFHHSVDEVICQYCEFRYACHRDSRRLNHLVDSGTSPKIYSGKKNLERWQKADIFRKELKSALLSMKKAVDLKTASARQRHYDIVIEFGKFLNENREGLPFYADYIDEILYKIDEFKKNQPLV